jgi:hypothetical protein
MQDAHTLQKDDVLTGEQKSESDKEAYSTEDADA